MLKKQISFRTNFYICIKYKLNFKNMKKFFFLFFIIPFLSFAEYSTGSIVLNDGSKLIGLVKNPDYNDSKIKFKLNEKADVQKIKIEDVKDFQIVNENNEIENYSTIYLATNKLFNPKEIAIEKNKSFAKVIKKGRISVYSCSFTRIGNSGKSRHNITEYYLQRENDNFAFSIGYLSTEFNFMAGPNIYAVIEINFKEICPNFSALVKKEVLKAKDFYKLVNIYEQNCGVK